ncbi:MAG: N-acyl homoserine lactonase family protein [Nitriliruptor sp.]|nr:MAG: N-acyl homoserine lactonase family protein [Nitriliruptor sp.]
MKTVETIRDVSVITTGDGEVHHEHIYGTRKPELWWIFFGRRWVRLPINVYVIAHADGLVLFDTGQDRAVVTDPDYYPDKITAFFYRHIFRDVRIGPEDTLPAQLERAGYSAAQVDKAVISHLHSDHVGGIADIPQAELYAGEEGFAYMRGPDHPERQTVYRDRIEIPGATWHMIRFEPTDDPTLAPFTEAFDLMGDGSMIVLPTPGHLPGSVSMLVRRTAAPPLLLVGDLTYDEQLLERDQVPAVCDDPEELLASYAKVRELKRHTPDLIILTAHDPHAADRLLTPR